MDFQTYISAAIRTDLSAPQYVAVAGRFSHSRIARLVHAAFGLTSELIEIQNCQDQVCLDLANLREEIGDMYWYIALGISALDQPLPFPEVSDDDYDYTTFSKFVGVISTISDEIKRHLFYGKELDFSALLVLFLRAKDYLDHYCNMEGISSKEAMEKNIAKLKVRYPDKFTEELALDRDLENERKVLE
jgi:hypothetical protein